MPGRETVSDCMGERLPCRRCQVWESDPGVAHFPAHRPGSVPLHETVVSSSLGALWHPSLASAGSTRCKSVSHRGHPESGAQMTSRPSDRAVMVVAAAKWL